MDEKQRNLLRNDSFEEEMHRRMSYEQFKNEDELEFIHLGMQDQELMSKAKISDLQQEHAMNQQKIEVLEKCLDETKQNLNQIYSFNSSILGQQMDRFNQERCMLLDKIDNLLQELRQKDKEMIGSESGR